VDTSLLRKTWPWALVASILLFAFLASIVDFEPPERRLDRPLGTMEDVEAFARRDDTNVLFILVDTLRASHLGSYGYERDTSPFLDRYASQGIRFARHLAQSSWTKCSMASLWTGLYPMRTGVTRFNEGLPEEALMPSEILRDAGFRTIGIYRNGWVSGYFGFEQGFDRYARPNPSPIPPSVRRENPTVSVVGSDEDATGMAREFLRLHGRGGDRWFLYLHLMDVHEYVYDEQTALFGTSNTDIYDNAILREDQILEAFLKDLAAKGFLEDTLVVITSDHGEAFGERGQEGHARSVYPEVTEVPFVIGYPFELEGGLVVESRTANVDLWPTIFELIGMEGLMDEADGISRVAEIRAAAAGEQLDDAEPVYAFLDQNWGGAGPPQPSVSVSSGPLRYVRGLDVRGVMTESLFDAEQDPQELRDIKESAAEVFEELRELGKEHVAEEPLWEGGAQTLEIDEMELNQLRALGYQVP
jgi:arylsulfatase A-like enzyme